MYFQLAPCPNTVLFNAYSGHLLLHNIMQQNNLMNIKTNSRYVST